MTTETKKTIVNETSYAPQDKKCIHPQFTLEVSCISDIFPGAFHDPEDLMRWICQNPYVRSVTLTSYPERS